MRPTSSIQGLDSHPSEPPKAQALVRLCFLNLVILALCTCCRLQLAKRLCPAFAIDASWIVAHQ
jgi:hypothetical protein